MHVRSILGVLLPLAVIAAPALADAPAADTNNSAGKDVSSLDLEQLLNTPVAAATKTAQTADEAPSVISVITRDQIRDYGWITLADILSHQPGFAVSQDYERTTLSARGNWEQWNNNHLLLLIDGVPYNDNETGTAYIWEQTPLMMVKNIEIIRGPGSALYGSYAMNGVIAINTLSGSELGGYAQARIGDDGVRIYDAVATAPLRYFNAVFGFNSYQTNGNSYMSYDGSARTDANGNLLQFNVPDARTSQYMFAKLEGTGPLEGLSLEYHNQAWSFKTGHGWLWYIADVGESMKESRQMFSARYQKTIGRISQEYAFHYQQHSLDYNMRFYPDDAFGGYYPAGATEVLLTRFDSMFARAQASVSPWAGATVLGGVEYTGFFYNGDQTHYSNVNVADAADGYPPFPNNSFQALGPYYQPIIGHPVNNIGVYAQFQTGKFLREMLSGTIGVREDIDFFDYADLKTAGNPVVSKSFQQLSPRVGLVATPLKNLSLKLLAAQAFRAPAPSELFGANTWALGSNIQQLQPEVVRTYELAAAWNINKNFTWRTNVYDQRFENQIAYGGYNTLHNVVSRTTAGVETELLANYDLGAAGTLGGFANYSYAALLSEQTYDPTITAEPYMTWFPSHTAKFGVDYHWRGLTASVQGLYQGMVSRRESDSLGFTAAYRAGVVPSWFTLDARISYRVLPWVRIGAQISNLFDTQGLLVKGGENLGSNNETGSTISFPFDYQIPGRHGMATVEIDI